MTQHHPDLAAEQAYIDHAYACLEHSRKVAWRLRDLTEPDLGGTFQARFERNAFDEALIKRLGDLDLGSAALVFGRIDRITDDQIDDGQSDDDQSDDDQIGDHAGDQSAEPFEAEGAVDGRLESFHIGRLAVADSDADPVVVDWRAPVAEPFYRATGREPMGLVRRRHFAIEGRTLLGIEDELFGEGHLGLGHDEGLDGTAVAPTQLRGYSTLIASIERGRTGTLGDIVATIQAEQDEIIRSPQSGVLVVQGGPGTGKTVVALHRAAYLLYTHRFPLEDQGVLVIGPNRVFLRYIEQVLPSLGEAGVEQVVLGDLVPDVAWGGVDSPLAARIKGDARMSDVIDQAINERERPLRDDVVVPFKSGYIRLKADVTNGIVKQARRRFRRHNAGRRFVEAEVWSAMAATWRGGDVTPGDVRADVRSLPEIREALERMWPVLTPAQLLHDLFGSTSLLRLAAAGVLDDHEFKALHRERSESVDDVAWSRADVALLDDAREVLGPRPGKGGRLDETAEIRTYGHIVIDEVQDLTPMQLKMATRRSLNGSMTIVGDLAQATGPMAPDDWDDVLRYMPDRKPARVIGLSVGYRIPAQIMELANKVMAVATPGLRFPESVRLGDQAPNIVRTADLHHGVIDEIRSMRASLPDGSVAVVAPDALCDDLSGALDEAGLEHGRAATTGLDHALTVVPVSVVKGLELDAVIVVEPARIADENEHGMRSLYVALTRSTQRLSIVHVDDLPGPLR